jgi:4-hydroxy-tetrahydrodipicolinate synthase
MQLHGVFTALVTPFAQGAIDRDSFASLCTRQLDAGVAGLVPCGTTGETPALAEEEWADLVSTAVRISDGSVPVIAGCGSNSTARTVATITRAKNLGADAALVVFPYYNKPNPAGLQAHVEAACRCGLPIVLYHVPGRTGQRLGLDQLAELCTIDGVVALKEATGDVALGQQLLDRTDRAILSGDDFTFAALMSMGGAGTISVLSNLAPAMTVAWAKAAADGDVMRLRELRTRLLPVVDYLFADTNPAPAKAALAAMGLCSNEMRLPLAPGAPPRDQLIAGLH